jgi:cob(I)alamin adenosyltransferase
VPNAKLTQDLIDEALTDIQTMLHKLGQSLEFHKMRVPAPRTIEQEADKYREIHDELNYDHNELEVGFAHCLRKLTLEQMDAYLDISKAVDDDHHQVFFLDAPGTLCDSFF